MLCQLWLALKWLEKLAIWHLKMSGSYIVPLQVRKHFLQFPSSGTISFWYFNRGLTIFLQCFFYSCSTQWPYWCLHTSKSQTFNELCLSTCLECVLWPSDARKLVAVEFLDIVTPFSPISISKIWMTFRPSNKFISFPKCRIHRCVVLREKTGTNVHMKVLWVSSLALISANLAGHKLLYLCMKVTHNKWKPNKLDKQLFSATFLSCFSTFLH